MAAPDPVAAVDIALTIEDLCLTLGARTVAGLFARLPAPAAVRIARTIGSTWFRIARRDARVAVYQIQHVLAIEHPADATRLARGVFARLGEEVVSLLQLCREDGPLTRHVTIQGREHLDAALARGRGVVWMSGHVGNWELMAATIARLHYPLHVIADPLHYPRLQRFVDEFRRRQGVVSLIRGRDTRRATLANHLARGHILGVLVDQRSKTWGAPLPFLGRIAHTPVVPAMVALDTGATMLVGIMERLAARQYRIRIFPPMLPPSRNGTLFERACAIMTDVNEILGRAIQQDPEAWPWFHRRWETTS